jgi:Flp pilus assembly pilin Flp
VPQLSFRATLLSGPTTPPVCLENQHKEIGSMSIHNVFTDADRRQKGVTTVEYAVMLVLVAIAVLAFGKGIANAVTDVFSTLSSSLK